ncbi:uncharacterized protein LOC126808816 [Patella vulgata]|uniref:uncharacterized protein LOC126808816 n=1 Tax=Patella vulgata TaxID=6465 RepID=UPI00218075C0|nr:uncharacterized protein LOC126808816 [Patella vulgata]
MEAEEDVVFEEYFYKYSKRQKLFLGKRDKWKQKYFILRKCGEKPVLEYFNKKPKNKSISPKGQLILWPIFRVEKGINIKNRQISFEITTPDEQLCLSGNSKKMADVFVFLLQIQSTLKKHIQDDVFCIQPEESDATTSIGCKGANCILHVSPCGLTLALQESRSVLAQWPLKSIRCFESSGFGQLTLEAGRVAPMGEGIYNFQCRNGEDIKIYDILDKYIVDTLDRAKPHRKGTTEEIYDYLEEFEKLHSLTVVSARLMHSPDILNILQESWDYNPPKTDKDDNVDSSEPTVVRRQTKVNSQDHTASIGLRQSQYNPKNVPTPTVPNPPPAMVTINNTFPQNNSQILTARPPAPPPRPGSQRSHGSNGTTTRSHRMRGRRSSSSSSVNSQDVQGDHSKSTSEYLTHTGSSSDLPSPPPEAYAPYLDPVSTSSYYEGTQTTGRVKSSQEKRRRAESIGSESQKATSCEDLSSHMKTVLYKSQESVDSLEDLVSHPDENMNNAKPPVPFPKLKEFRPCDDKPDYERRRSLDYHQNIRRDSNALRSPSPNARHIRKLLAQKRQPSEEPLRKSNSNPNFLNLGSKQDLHVTPNGIVSPPNVSPTLSHKNKQASRSLVSLLPGNLRKALSREKIRSETPDRGDNSRSRSNTPSRSRANSLERSFRRRRSNSIRGPDIKNINFTEKTRSFRKVKSAVQNGHVISNQNGGTAIELESNCQATNKSNSKSVSADVANNNVHRPGRRIKHNESFGPADRIINLPRHEREETRC